MSVKFTFRWVIGFAIGYFEGDWIIVVPFCVIEIE